MRRSAPLLQGFRPGNPKQPDVYLLFIAGLECMDLIAAPLAILDKVAPAINTVLAPCDLSELRHQRMTFF